MTQRRKKSTCNPAYSVVRKLGGVVAVARYLGIDPGAVSRWSAPLTEKNGRGGSIPDKYQGRLLQMAKESRVKLSAADLIKTDFLSWTTKTGERACA